jgi:hypothetical protein
VGNRLEDILTGDFVAELSRGMSSAGEHEEREGSQFSPEPAGGLEVAYWASAHQAIEAACPAWPDLVQAYREASQ